MKPLFTHLRQFTSHAVLTNEQTLYLHIICADWLLVDGCSFFLPWTVGLQLNMLTFISTNNTLVSFSMFYQGTLILSCYFFFAFLTFGCLSALSCLSPLCLARLSISFSFFYIYHPHACICPPGVLTSSPYLSISPSAHALPALLSFPATPLFHHHVHAALHIVQQ